MLTSYKFFYIKYSSLLFLHLLPLPYFLFYFRTYSYFNNFLNICKNKTIKILPKLTPFYKNKKLNRKLLFNKQYVKSTFKNLIWKVKSKTIKFIINDYKKIPYFYKIKLLKSNVINFPYFNQYSYAFYRNWNFLIGNSISQFQWDFLLKKRIYRIDPQYQCHTSNYFTKSSKIKKLNHIKKKSTKSVLQILTKKKSRNFFFNINLNLETLPNKKNMLFSKPYTFLHSTRIMIADSISTIDILIKLYNKNINTFVSLKNLIRTLSYKENSAIVYTKYYTFLYNLKRYSPIINFNKFTKTNPQSNLFKKSSKKNRYFYINLFRKTQFNKLKTYLLYLNQLNLYPTLKTFKLRKKIKIIFNLYTKQPKFLYLIKKSNTIFKNFPNTYLFNTNYTLAYKSIQFDKYLFFNNIIQKSLLKPSNIKFNIKQFISTQWNLSYVYRNLLLPIYYTKENTHFLSNSNGFTYLNDSTLYDFFNEKSYNIKKIFYSFITKNEIHKYILKKYSKMIWSDGKYSESSLKKPNSLITHEKSNLTQYDEFDFFKDCSFHLKSLMMFSFMSQKWTFFKNRITSYQVSNNSVNSININRIRFKPGYASQWRESRSNFKLIFKLKMRYQYKLTRYLAHFIKFTYSNFFLLFEMELGNILFKSRFFTDKNLIKYVIQSNNVYVNGLICNNSKFQLYTNDIVQLIISIKYYVLYRHLINWSLKRRTKIRRIIISKIPSESETEDKQRSRHLTNWILTNEGVGEDVLKYCEIDYFTLSLLILYEPFKWSDLNKYNILRYRPTTFRLYNWKYIT